MTNLGGDCIIFLCSHSSPGGVQELWANLAEAIEQRGFRVKLIALYPYRVPPRETPADLPWDYVVPQRGGGIAGQIRIVRELAKIIDSTKPVAIITAMPASNVVTPIAAWLASSACKVVTSHHSPIATHNRLLRIADCFTSRMRNVVSVVSVSSTVQKDLLLRNASSRAKLRTIKNAIPRSLAVRLAELKGLRDSRPRARVVAATGRLAKQKNYPVLIKAAALMPDVQVKIVGSGPDEQNLRQLADDICPAGNVRFLGQRSRQETLEELASSDVFVQPSLFEGHSLALLEAASLGLPLIVSDVAVQIEGITSRSGAVCGISVGVDDHVELANQIRRVCDEPSLNARLAAQAILLASEADFDGMVDEYVKTFSSSPGYV